MQAKIVPMSDVLSHPYRSLLPDEHIGTDEHVQKLLKEIDEHDPRGSRRKRLKWMLEHGVVPSERLKSLARDAQHKIMAQPVATCRRIQHNLKSILEPSE